jgi:hypothetical protein
VAIKIITSTCEEGERLGSVHKSTGSVEILSYVKKLYKIEHVAVSQRVQYTCALDPSHSHEEGGFIINGL